MAQFFDDFSSYDSGSLLPQNPNYVSETDPQIDASDRLNFTATTHFGSGDAIIYIGLGSSETIEVFAEAISNSSRPGVCALNSFDLLAPYLGYATSRVTDVNTELRFANESSTDLYANGVADGAPAGVSINIRYRISKNELSQYVIRYKAWIVGDDEPVGWLSEYVDTRAESPTEPLYPGVFLRSGSGTTTITNKFGVGTDGDAAPTATISNDTVTSDIELINNIQQAITAELDINYDLRESLQSDLQSTWDMLNAIHMDVGATWSIIQNLIVDLQADWQIVQNVDIDVELPWTIESAIQTAIKDLNASWHIRHAVVVSLNTQWQLLAALEIDLQSRWNIAESIITDMQLLFAQRQQVLQSATLTWHQISIAENSITFTWKLGDTVLPPISIIKIRPETRVFRAVIH